MEKENIMKAATKSYIENMVKRDKKIIERDKRIAIKREFAIEQRPCYFCEAVEQIRFREHWLFCPLCSAIYTYMIVHKVNCKHADGATPVVLNRCWFKDCSREKVYIKHMSPELQVCSVCGMHCEAGGW
jgi:hypothetical protein